MQLEHHTEAVSTQDVHQSEKLRLKMENGFEHVNEHIITKVMWLFLYYSIPFMGNGDQFLRHSSLGSIFVIDELVFKVASITFKLKENMALVMSLQNSLNTLRSKRMSKKEC